MKQLMHEPHVSLNSGATQPVNAPALTPSSQVVTTRQDRSPEAPIDLTALPPAVLELAMLLARVSLEHTEQSVQPVLPNQYREQS